METSLCKKNGDLAITNEIKRLPLYLYNLERFLLYRKSDPLLKPKRYQTIPKIQ